MFLAERLHQLVSRLASFPRLGSHSSTYSVSRRLKPGAYSVACAKELIHWQMLGRKLCIL